MSEDNKITFSEFNELCQEAGISIDNMEVLEQDFRAGTALADVTDALITDYEANPKTKSAGEAMKEMDVFLTLLEEGQDIAGSRELAVKLAVTALRYIAEVCHDEGKN